MRVNLTGLTKEQCDMLDMLWDLDTRENFLKFMETLEPEKLTMALTLQEMVLQEMSEANSDIDPNTASNMLKSIGVNI
jgi:hypothetical protein